MSLGSPPSTPPDERAMKDWVSVHMTDKDVELLNQRSETAQEKAPAQAKPMTTDELREWLHHPGIRTDFEEVDDILEFHGVLGEFERDFGATAMDAISPSRSEHGEEAEGEEEEADDEPEGSSPSLMRPPAPGASASLVPAPPASGRPNDSPAPRHRTAKSSSFKLDGQSVLSSPERASSTLVARFSP